MKASRVLARANKGAPTLQASRQPLSTRAASSSLSSTPASGRSSAITSSSPRTLPRQHALRANALSARRSYASAPESSAPLNKTPLYDLHVAHGAKMVPFGGYHMPVQYAGQSVGQEHHFTRSHASLFDVGHMVQHRFEGPGALAFLQRVTPAGLTGLAPYSSTLSALLWPGTGGIVDDTIVTKLADDSTFYVVTNAGCRDKDLKYLGEQLEQWQKDGGAPVRHTVLADQGLVALQGPLAEQILADVLADAAAANLSELYFGQCRYVTVKVAGGRTVEDVLVSRGGYTGEDGFEISIPPADAAAVTEALLATAHPDRLRLAGLGARDSLRLEAGMCLYGHDLDDSTTPVEGALGWIVGRDRRAETDVAKGAFYGADVVLPQLKPKSKGGAGVERRRVGFAVEKGAPAREGSEVVDGEGNVVGVVTSGCPSPSLNNQNIAMGYVKDGLHKAGTELAVLVRGRKRKAVVAKMPFVESKYKKAA
ncbi:glycine cleavage system T protein [Hypoxylon sp. FL1150]|nr:glycine cleavage system T protein [Hypoxylon sp. FL1150]